MDLLHLKKPSIFIEIGTGDLQWNDENLCSSIATVGSGNT